MDGQDTPRGLFRDLVPPSSRRARDETYWSAHLSGLAVSFVAHVIAMVLLLVVHGEASGGSARAASVAASAPPAVKARLVKLGRPAQTKLARTSTVAATAPRADIQLSRTGVEETNKRTKREVVAKGVLDDDALRRTLQRAAELGEMGDPHAGLGSPEGVRDGEIDAAEARESDLYMTMLQRLFRRGFRVPATVDSASALRAAVRVTINRDLSVGSPVVARSSGNTTFDQSALDSVRAVSTVPPPPVEIEDRFLGRSITLRFSGASN